MESEVYIPCIRHTGYHPDCWGGTWETRFDIVIECGSGGGGEPFIDGGGGSSYEGDTTGTPTYGGGSWTASPTSPTQTVYTGPIPVYYDTEAESQKLYERFLYGADLSTQQKDYLSQHKDISDAVKNYLYINKYSNEAKEFVKQVINLANTEGYTVKEIANWFLNQNELKDGEEEINPNLITFETPVTLGALPSFNDFINAFPKNGTSGNYSQMPANEVYSLVGGTLLNSYNNDTTNSYSNACSIRGSRGLLYSNITIPVLKYNGLQRTQKGGDLKNYILDAVSFNTFMKAKFGEAQHVLTGADANDLVKVANLLNGKNGIYVIINNNPSSSGAGYSGHVDTIINGICVGNAYTRPRGGVKSIKIWTLN